MEIIFVNYLSLLKSAFHSSIKRKSKAPSKTREMRIIVKNCLPLHGKADRKSEEIKSKKILLAMHENYFSAIDEKLHRTNFKFFKNLDFFTTLGRSRVGGNYSKNVNKCRDAFSTSFYLRSRKTSFFIVNNPQLSKHSSHSTYIYTQPRAGKYRSV